LQDNDRFLSLSGSYPFGATLLTSKNQLTIQFKTDETLSQSGFWIRFHGKKKQISTRNFTFDLI